MVRPQHGIQGTPVSCLQISEQATQRLEDDSGQLSNHRVMSCSLTALNRHYLKDTTSS